MKNLIIYLSFSIFLLAHKTYKKGNKSYTVTQIRRNLNENNKIINY